MQRFDDPDGPSRRVLAALGAVALAVTLYAVLIAQQLLVVLMMALLAFGLYLSSRLLVAVERLADGLHRIGAALEPPEP